MSEKQPQWLIGGFVDDLSTVERSLVLQTLNALCRAELPDVVDALTGRMLGPIPEGLDGDAQEARLVDAEGYLQPYVALALLDVQYAATVPAWSPKMRRDRALEAIEAAGF